MHRRLVEWGNVQLRGGGFLVDDDGVPDNVRRVEWTGKQREDARLLHAKVIALEWRSNIVLQVFYKAGQASHWSTLSPREQHKIETELTREVNRRAAMYSRETGIPMTGINPRYFGAVRDRAIATLVENERAGK